MKSVIILLSCLVAVTLAVPDRKAACNRCARAGDRPSWCGPCDDDNSPKPPPPGTCLAPDCSSATNRRFLFANINPTKYWQCDAIVGGWKALERPCACGTFFDYESQRCTHLHDWSVQCPGQPTNPPMPDCPKCPSCGPGQNPTDAPEGNEKRQYSNMV